MGGWVLFTSLEGSILDNERAVLARYLGHKPNSFSVSIMEKEL